MQTLRKKLVPALITSLCTILLPLSGCKIVPNDQRASPDISQERSAEQPEGALLLVFKTVLTGFRRCQSVALEKCSSDA